MNKLCFNAIIIALMLAMTHQAFLEDKSTPAKPTGNVQSISIRPAPIAIPTPAKPTGNVQSNSIRPAPFDIPTPPKPTGNVESKRIRPAPVTGPVAVVQKCNTSVEKFVAKLFRKSLKKEIRFNKKAGRVGKKFFKILAKSLNIAKTSAGIPVATFTAAVQQIGLEASKKVQAIKFDVAVSGFINKKEAKKYFRKILKSYAKAVAFKNAQLPSVTGRLTKKITKVIKKTARQLVKTRRYVEKLFDNQSAKGPVTTQDVLTLFKITSSGQIQSNNLNKDQFYKLFRGLIKAAYREYKKAKALKKAQEESNASKVPQGLKAPISPPIKATPLTLPRKPHV